MEYDYLFYSMKIAFLVLCHSTTDLISKVVKIFPHCDFFIHLDEKADQEVLNQEILVSHNTKVIRTKKVYWGGFSMVRATLDLIQEALKSTRSYDYFFLISESCFPIKNPEQIVSILSSGGEFLSVERKLDMSHPRTLHDTYVSKYYQNDFSFLNCRFEPENTYHYLIRRLSLAFLLRVNRYTKTRRSPGDMEIYHGSTWWCLSAAAITHIVNFIKDKRKFTRFFRYTHCSDEMFFQSILMNSDFRNKMVPKNDKYHYATHYIDWETTRGKQPKVLTEEDYKNIIHSKAMFARKMDSKNSEGLIKKLETSLK